MSSQPMYRPDQDAPRPELSSGRGRVLFLSALGADGSAQQLSPLTSPVAVVHGDKGALTISGLYGRCIITNSDGGSKCELHLVYNPVTKIASCIRPFKKEEDEKKKEDGWILYRVDVAAFEYHGLGLKGFEVLFYKFTRMDALTHNGSIHIGTDVM